MATPLTTLAVFDQPIAKKTVSNGAASQNGLKERSIRVRPNKNSPKLSPKTKRVTEGEDISGISKVAEQSSSVASLHVKPLSAGSGIPKPTAAVKGTAKVIPKNPSIEDSAILERTPGDGKEVSGAAIQATCNSSTDEVLSCKPEERSSRSESFPSVQVPINGDTGNPGDTDREPVANNHTEVCASQLESASIQKPDEGRRELEGSLESKQQEGVADQLVAEGDGAGRSQVAKVLPMSNQSSGDHPEDEEDESMNVQPMTPLFNTNLIKRHDHPISSAQSTASTTAVKRAANGSYTDPLDGYLSESGASLYARKMHYLAVTQRLKDDDR